MGKLIASTFSLGEKSPSHECSVPLWSKNSASLPRKGSLPDRRLMPLPAHSTSADHPVVPCTAQFRYPRSSLDSARGTGGGSACPGDCAPRGNGPRIAAGLGAAISLCSQIFVPQQQFLIDGAGDVGQHASPNHFVPLG